MLYTIIFLIAFVFVVAIIFLIFWGTLKLFKVVGSTFKKSLLVFGLSFVATIVASIVFSFSPVLPTILSTVATTAVFCVILKKFLAVKFWKSVAIYFVFTIFLTVASLLIVIPTRLFVGEPFYVKGRAMEPTYKNNDYLLINKLSKNYQRGDVVVFRYPRDPQEYFLKRIIGLPGEKIEIKDGDVFINGIKLEEPYLVPDTKTFSAVPETVELKSDEYFMLGDNRNSSKDSRSFGPVNKSFIVGEISLKGWSLK